MRLEKPTIKKRRKRRAEATGDLLILRIGDIQERPSDLDFFPKTPMAFGYWNEFHSFGKAKEDPIESLKLCASLQGRSPWGSRPI